MLVVSADGVGSKGDFMIWTVVRFPIRSWSYGGKLSSTDYEECEVWRIEADSAKLAVKKAQAKRRRDLTKSLASLGGWRNPRHSKRGITPHVGDPAGRAVVMEPQMSKTIKSPGGITVRFIEALNGFRKKFGYWPTTLEAEAQTIAFLATESLTPLGFFLLQSKVDVVIGDQGKILAKGPSGEVFDYGEEGW